MKKTTTLFIAVLFFLLSFAQSTLVPFGSSWRYLDDGSDQGEVWRTTSFNDNAWKSGVAEFGYGDRDEATVVSYGNSKSKKYITTYFRKEITIDNISRVADFAGNLKRDDGAVVYINGIEVYRSNMPSGEILYNTLAAQGANNDDGNNVHRFQVDHAVFIEGVNIVAVEIHQGSITSSDMSFDMALEATLNLQPDNIPPDVQSILRESPAEASITVSSVVFRISFSEVVTGVDATDFIAAVTAGALSATIISVADVNSDGDVYDITIGSISGTGTLRLDIKSTGTNISDTAGNLLVNGYTTGETYSINQEVSPQPSTTLTRGPYLQMASQSAITLRWRTSIATDSKIEVGTSINSYTLSGRNATVTKEHEVRISGLTAGTKYFYRFGSSTQILQGGSGNYFVTAPLPNTLGKIRVAAFGDCGNLNSVQANVLNAYLDYASSAPAALMLLLGDNAYQDGTDAEYQDKFFEPYDTVLKNHVLFPSPGNHDYHTTTRAARTAPYYKSFSVPADGECGGVASGTKSFYSFDWGNIHFISLDSYGEESDGSRLYDTLGPQVTWVKQDLEANNSKWTIAFFHHPPFTKGTHDADAEGGDLGKIREEFIPILERYGVDLVLCGHSHVYERSYLLKGYYGTESNFSPGTHTVTTSSGKYNGTSNSCPYVTAYGKFNHGTVYVVAGSAARSGDDVHSGFPHNALPFATSDGGMFYFEIEDNRLDAKFINEDGVVFDQFTLMKEVNKTREIIVADGDSVTLTASWIGEYDWSNGATSRSITVVPNSNITYTVTDNRNCLRDVFSFRPGVVTTSLRPYIQAKTVGSEIDGIQIFPTIVSRGISVTIQRKTPGVVEAAILDNSGKVIRTLRLSGTASIGTSDLPAGIYFISLDGGRNSRMKFIVAE